MRTLLSNLAAAVLLAALSTPAFAACGDPGSSPDVAGQSLAGLQNWDDDDPLRSVFVFNPDCSLDLQYPYESIGSGRWSQAGSVVTLDLNNGSATYVGTFNGDGYSGEMRNFSHSTGTFSFRQVPRADIRRYLWADLDQSTCGAPQSARSMVGESFTGTVTWNGAKPAPLTFRFRPDCLAIIPGQAGTEAIWAQEGEAVMVSVADEAFVYVGLRRGAAFAGEVKARDGRIGRFELVQAEY
ncbi:MAG: hypothetical protein EON96_00840 [Caulobacteraceae bacterium]|nr:MAG: hypothetical protein EON96_00840 [Caulobacteraceae bacterium]